MFEPFHKYKVEEFNNFNFRDYIPPLDNNETIKQKYFQILSGGIKNKWIDQYNKKYYCNKRIIKAIRINQSLKWVKLNFPEIPIIYIIRHPCAVSLSKLRLNWDDNLAEYMSQPNLMNDHLEPYKKIINSAITHYEKHFMMWCIENSIVLNTFNRKDIFILFYEYLISEPEKTLIKLYKYLNINYNSNIIDALNKPSSQSNTQSAIFRSKNILSDWTNYIDIKQKEYANNILKEFNLDRLYILDPLPSINEDEDPFCI